MKFTCRDLSVALVAILASACVFTFAGQKPIMRSSVADWNSMVDIPNNHGSMRQVFDAPTPTLDNLEVHISTLKPGMAAHPPHRHPNEELILVKQGTVQTLSNGQWKQVGPGSVIFNASNQLHDLRNVGKENAVYFVVNVKTAATPAK